MDDFTTRPDDLISHGPSAADGGPFAPEEGRGLPPLHVRFYQLFVAPGRLFAALRMEPRAWGAILLGIVLTVGASFAVPPDIWVDFVRNQMLQSGQEVPPEMLMNPRISQVFGSIFTLIGWPLFTLIQALLFSAVFLFGLGYEGSFKQYFAVSAHTMLLVAAAGVVFTPVRIFTRRMDFSPSLEALVPFLEEGFLMRWLAMMDLVSLWAFALAGLGAAVIDGRRGEGSSMGVAIGAASLIFLLVASFTG